MATIGWSASPTISTTASFTAGTRRSPAILQLPYSTCCSFKGSNCLCENKSSAIRPLHPSASEPWHLRLPYGLPYGLELKTTRVYAPPYGFTAPTPLKRSHASHLDRIQVKFISGEREQQLQLRQEAARLLARRAEIETEPMSARLDIHNTGRRSEGRGRRSARPPTSDLRPPISDL